MTTTMISNWPDAIRCGDGTRDSGAVFMLHAAGSNTGDISWYVQVFSGEYRYVNFKSDGSYNTKGGYDGSSRGCLGQSIKQLYDAGKAFNFVSSKTYHGSDTMISNWPDAIRCGDGTRDSGAVFMLHAAGSNTGDISLVCPSIFWRVQICKL